MTIGVASTRLAYHMMYKIRQRLVPLSTAVGVLGITGTSAKCWTLNYRTRPALLISG